MFTINSGYIVFSSVIAFSAPIFLQIFLSPKFSQPKKQAEMQPNHRNTLIRARNGPPRACSGVPRPGTRKKREVVLDQGFLGGGFRRMLISSRTIVASFFLRCFKTSFTVRSQHTRRFLANCLSARRLIRSKKLYWLHSPSSSAFSPSR